MQAAKLDLRSRRRAEGQRKGPVIIAHKPEESSLYKKISGAEKPLMPMDGRLPDAQIAAIRQWIEQGAAWDAALDGGTVKQDLAALEQWKVPDGAREWWAFKPGKWRFPSGDADGNAPVDAFLRLTHQKMKLRHARRVEGLLLRRVSRSNWLPRRRRDAAVHAGPVS
jgi:hypothetical protein